MVASKAEREAALQAAAKGVPYFRLTCDGKVSYLPAWDAELFTAETHYIFPEIEIMDGSGRVVGARKSVRGALKLLTRLADAANVERLRK